MRNLVFIFIGVFVCILANAQTDVSYGNYDPFFDTVNHPHSTVKPLSRVTNEKVGFTVKDNESSAIQVFPVINQLVGVTAKGATENTSFRSGVGFGTTVNLGDKFYARLLATGSYYQREGDTLLSNGLLPNTYFYKEDGVNRTEVQPLFRLSFTPNKFFNFQAGIDHNFIGEGERSILLGDHGTPYPFAQIRSTLWRFEFVNLYQFFREKEDGNWRTKNAASHMLNYQVTDRFQFGVFESVIFEPRDTLLKRGYEWEYLNPFLFYRPIEYSIGSQDKIIVGANVSYRFDNLMLYGQFVLDDFAIDSLRQRTRWWANKYGGQVGFKVKVDLATLQIRYQSELNVMRPFTFAHKDISTVYGHQGMPLGHPLGANFVEALARVEVRHKSSLYANAMAMVIQQGGLDPFHYNYGQDIYHTYDEKPFESGYRIGGNGKLNRLRMSLEVGYTLYKPLQLVVFARPIMEQQTGALTQNNLFIFGGIRTNLWNERAFGF